MARRRAKPQEKGSPRAGGASGKNRSEGAQIPAFMVEGSWRERLQEHENAVACFFSYKIRGPSKQPRNIPEKVSTLCDATFERAHSTIARMNLSSDLYSEGSFLLWNASNVWDGLAYRANQEDAEAFNDLFLLCHDAIRGFFRARLQVDSNTIEDLVHDTYLQARDNITWYPYNAAYPVYTFFRNIAGFILRRYLYEQPTFQRGILKRERRWVNRKFKEGDLLYFLLDMLAQSPERQGLASVERTMVTLALEKCKTKPATAAFLGIEVEELDRKLEQGRELERSDLIIRHGDSVRVTSPAEKKDKVDPSEEGIAAHDRTILNMTSSADSPLSNAETVQCFLEALRLRGCSSKPHHYVAFGFSRLLDYGPERVVDECSDVSIRDLTVDLMISLHRALGELIGLERMQKYFSPALEKCDVKAREIYTEPEYNQLRKRHGEIRVGDLALSDFYGKHPVHDITSWVYRTARRAIERLRGSMDSGDVSSC